MRIKVDCKECKREVYEEDLGVCVVCGDEVCAECATYCYPTTVGAEGWYCDVCRERYGVA